MHAVVTAVTSVLCFVALGPTARAQGQAPAMPTMEFDAVVRQAVEKNPTVARAATNISRAETLLQQARAIALPIVTSNLANATLDAARGFTGGVTQPQNQLAFNINASVPVLAATSWAGINQARDQVDVTAAGVAEVRQQIIVSAAQTYLAVIAARRQVAVSEEALKAERAHLDYAMRRFEAGAGSRLNQLRAAQLVSAEESRLEDVKLALRTAQEALGVLVAADSPVDAGAEPLFDMTGAMEDTAWATTRPDLITQAAVQRAAERVVKDSWRDWVPTVDASFVPTLLTPSGLFQPSKTWRFSIVATQVIYEGGQRRIARDQRDLSLTQAKITMSALEIRARSEVRLAQEALQARERARVFARRAADETAEVLRIATAAFEVGATTNLEVIDAQRSDRFGQTQAELAEDAVRRAKLDLLVALGRFK